MPDDPDARDSDGNDAHSERHSPDLVGEELADGAHIWRVYDRVAREEDRERIGNWNRGLDNLALFAGLFSAVTTAFIIEARQDTQPDYARLTFLVLNASAAGVSFIEEPFVIDSSACTTYCLWIASLVLSLTAALIAIMGKDWIGMYASRPVCNPRQWAEIRTYRLACVDGWYMSGVIASAPVLLHLSLALFAAGLVLFVASDSVSQRVALGLSLAAGGLYLVTVLSAIVFPSSPFKSPATQAFRSVVASLCTSLYARLVHPPKRRPVALLQQATLIIGAALSHPSPANILPFVRSPRRRLLQPFSHVPFDLARSLRDVPTRFPGAVRAGMSATHRLVSEYVRSTLDAYYYRRQCPRPKPWHASLHASLKLVLSDHWAEIREQPTPELLAQSLSHLNAMTQSTDVFHAILVALGDIAIGRTVAPLVSSVLRSRLETQIRHPLPSEGLVTLSRFVLADLHLSPSPQTPSWVFGRFAGTDGNIQSESVVFALAELGGTMFRAGEQLRRYFPDPLTQPRAFQYLLPIVTDLEVFIVLAWRYWDPQRGDRSINIEGRLRQLLCYRLSFRGKARLARRLSRHSSLVELLVYTLDVIDPVFTTSTCAMLIKALKPRPDSPLKEHPCLVFAFGHASPGRTKAAWAALSESRSLWFADPSAVLQYALPLRQFLPRELREGGNTTVSVGGSDFGICLARAIVHLLSPSRDFADGTTSGSQGSDDYIDIPIRELCTRCLQTYLCRPLSPLSNQQRLKLITLMLETSVLLRVCDLRNTCLRQPYQCRARRESINVLTGISRHLTTLLRSTKPQDYVTGARLFCLFSLSSTTDRYDRPVEWNLGTYIHKSSPFFIEQHADTKTAMLRLLRALRTLRPLCATRDDLRTAWQRIRLAPDPEYSDSFWDSEDSAFGLAALLSPDDCPPEDAESQMHAIPLAVIDEPDAHYWLDAAMR